MGAESCGLQIIYSLQSLYQEGWNSVVRANQTLPIGDINENLKLKQHDTRSESSHWECFH